MSLRDTRRPLPSPRFLANIGEPLDYGQTERDLYGGDADSPETLESHLSHTSPIISSELGDAQNIRVPLQCGSRRDDHSDIEEDAHGRHRSDGHIQTV